MSDQPLVSIGIPTFNRPEGLKRTLSAISSQSFGNIEIIVSDNCSENIEVRRVIDDFKSRDSRIKSFVQETNIGAFNNFKFVLEQATGDYFMWAADDDSWNSEFIEELVKLIGHHSAAFCNYSIRYEKSGRVDHIDIKANAQGGTIYEQGRNFLQERLSSLIYGLYKTSDIKWFVKIDEPFDWLDCYVIFKIILLHNGYIISKKELYAASISGSEYEYKPTNPSKKRMFSYYSYVINSSKLIYQANIKFSEKLKLMVYLIEVNFRSFIATERCRKHYRLYTLLYKVFNRLRPAVYFYEH